MRHPLSVQAWCGALLLVTPLALTAAVGQPAAAGSVTTPAAAHHSSSAGNDTPQAVARAVADSADCGPPSATAVPDHQPIVVVLAPITFRVGTIDPAVWASPLNDDPTWRLHFEGFMYLPELAARAAADGSLGSLTTMVDQVAAFHTQNPDPGSSVRGWDEGTAQRRLYAENCLYALTLDPRLIAGMMADAQVQVGPRYYGPPYAAVHNHGLMANLRLVRAGDLLDRPEWKRTALTRMLAEAPYAFSALGTSVEQSSMYQGMIAVLWAQAADYLRLAYGETAAVVAIREMSQRGTAVFGFLTEPDGRIVQIGDSELGPGEPHGAGVFRDDPAGLVVGKWSATDPSSTYYTLRYGPVRRAHGHNDRGAVTWTTDGVRVLVGPGIYNYASDQPWYAWQLSPSAHNTAALGGSLLNGRAAVSVDGSTIQGPAHGWRLIDRQYPLIHTRSLNINRVTQRLAVSDSFAGAGTFRQSWHLDPSWVLVAAPMNGQSFVFANPLGRTLTITTSGRLSNVQRGDTSPVAGWNFPAQDHQTPAYQLTIRSLTRTVSTTFSVT